MHPMLKQGISWVRRGIIVSAFILRTNLYSSDQQICRFYRRNLRTRDHENRVQSYATGR